MGRHAPWLLAGLSLILNCAGSTWGLPARWHPDEKADVVAAMVGSGSLRPDSFVNPSLPLYAQWPLVWLQDRLATGGWLAGRAADPLLLCRGLSALAGAGAVLVLGLAVRGASPPGPRHLPRAAAALRASPSRAGGTAGPDTDPAPRPPGPPWSMVPPLLLALTPGLVNLAHFATPEAWLVLGASVTLALCLAHLRGEAHVWILGLALGLTASTKYTAAALLAPALVAVELRRRSETSWREWLLLSGTGAVLASGGLALLGGPGAALASRLSLPDARLLRAESALGFVHSLGWVLLLGGAALMALSLLAWTALPRLRPWMRWEVAALGLTAALAFLAGMPYAAIDPVAFLSGLAFNAQTRHEYKGLVGASTSFGPYLGLLDDALTGPLLAAALLGVLVAAGRALRGERRSLVLLAAALAPYLLVASSGHRALRFLAPALPATAWLAALGLAALPRAGLAALGLVAGRAALGSLLLVRLFLVDARLQAARWIEQNVPQGARIDLIANVAGYGPTPREGHTWRQVPVLSREMAPPARFAEAAAVYPREGAPWLVLTASFYERFLDHPEQEPERAAFFRDLLGGRLGYVEVARFRQRGWLRPEAEFVDPEIVVLRKAAP